MRHFNKFFAVCLLAASASLAPAAIIQVNSRAALGGNDFVNWGQLGPDLTVVNSPLSFTSNLGVGPNSGTDAGDFWSVMQGNTWGGNFAANDNVLFQDGNGAVTFNFAIALMGVGMQFQSSDFGAFQASITAFDASNNNLGTFSATGNSNGAGNNSAIFLGILDTVAEIKKITFNVTIGAAAPSDDPFAINRMDILYPTGPAATPEPGTMLLMGAGLALVSVKMFRRR